MDEFEFDPVSLDDLTRDLEASIARFGPEVDATLVKVGGLVAGTAKKVAEQAGSESIPPTVRVVPGHEMVAVRAGGQQAPVGALWELGNRGRGGRKKDTFSHPVYGNRKVWVQQPRHPFLKKARSLCRRQISDLMNGAYDRVLEPIRRGGPR